uniref:Metalloendopeptidase n=1 Tax=Strongyloides papillosus TaxID=174720 RepID=A0A0N5BJ61_STREA
MIINFIILPFLILKTLANYDEIFENDNVYVRERRGIRKHYHPYPIPIPYRIDDGLDNTTILKAFKDLGKLTCLTFIQKPFKTRGIVFQHGRLNRVNHLGGSMIKKTYVKIKHDCLNRTGCVKHMLGLALGMDLETNRHDRDKYLIFLKKNVRKSDLYWFVKQQKGSVWVRNTGFDYGSIMTAPLTWKGIKGRHVFKSNLSKYYDLMLGQRYDYSFNDIKQINDFYCGNVCKNKIRGCTNGGYPDPKDCRRKCRCPDEYVGQQCTSIRPNRENCGKRIRKAKRLLEDIIIEGKRNCYFYIRAPRYTQIRIVVAEIKTRVRRPCYKNMGLEIKYRHNKGTTGLCLCGHYRKYTLNPFNSRVLVHYTGQSEHDRLHLRYRMEK